VSQGRRKTPDERDSYAHLSLSWLNQRACSRLLHDERIDLEVDMSETNDVPTPVRVAFSSGGGMRSNTPTRSSPSEKRLANSTARCWSSNSGFLVYPARTVAMRSCWLLLVVGREEIFVIDANTNCRVSWLAYGESRMERIRSMISTSVTYTGIRKSRKQHRRPYRFCQFFVY